MTTEEGRKLKAAERKAARLAAQSVTHVAATEQKAMGDLTREDFAKLSAQPEQTPPSGSIIRKARNLGAPSTLVFGNSGTGKSSLVRDLLLKNGHNPLWLALNNSAALSAPRCAEWDVASPPTWGEFTSTIVKPAMAGKLKGYDALVIDGGDFLTAAAMADQAPNGQAQLQDWLAASNHVRDTLVKLREVFGSLWMIVEVVPDKEGNRKLNLNPYIKNQLVPLFGDKLYTAIVKERDADKRLTGKIKYTVQWNSALALDFVPGEVRATE